MINIKHLIIKIKHININKHKILLIKIKMLIKNMITIFNIKLKKNLSKIKKIIKYTQKNFKNINKSIIS